MSKKEKIFVNKKPLYNLPKFYLNIKEIYALAAQSKLKNSLLSDKTTIWIKYFAKSIFPGGNLIM